MRFELYLTKLPDLRPDEIKPKLGNLPALSVGVLKMPIKILADSRGLVARNAEDRPVVPPYARRAHAGWSITPRLAEGGCAEELCSGVFGQRESAGDAASDPKPSVRPRGGGKGKEKTRREALASSHSRALSRRRCFFLFKWRSRGGIDT